MIARVTVEKLFGKFNYSIKFSPGINIITGPNGYGKTTILNMINYILEDNYYELSKVPFKKFVIETAEGITLTYEHKDGDFYCEGEKIYVPEIIDKLSYANKIRLRYKNEELVNSGYRSNMIDSEDYLRDHDNFNPIILTDPTIISDLRIKNVNNAPYVEKLFNFCREVGNSSYLEANRLYGFNPNNKKYFSSHKENREDENYNYAYEVIDTLNSRMNNEMTTYITKYTLLSNYYDSIFFEKLGESSVSEKNYSKEEFDKDRKWISDFAISLVNYGLLKSDEIMRIKRAKYNDKFDEVYKLFMQQFKMKTSVFLTLIEKIELFKSLINDCLLDKTININSDKQIIVTDKKTNDKIQLSKLSSGEKEIIIMYFSLLFNSDELKNYKLFLIDEPEISLHIEWQYKFLDDLERIEATNEEKHQFIVCTHSPQIVNERWNKTIDLTKTMFK